MSLLTLMQDTCHQIGLLAPTNVVASPDLTYKQLLAILHTDAANEIKSRIRWPELTRIHTITLVADQEAYALPADIERQLMETHWNRNDQWPLYGPVSPQDWELRKHGVGESTLRQHWQVSGVATNQFYIDPVPTASDAGQVLSFAYQSRTWIRPKTWTASTAYGANTYTFYNGNIYFTAGGGTTGSTAPTHTSGSATDGSVSWAFYSDPYERFQADTDETLIPEYIAVLALKYLWCLAKGLPFLMHQQRFRDELKRQATKKRGARTLNLSSYTVRQQAPWPNIPDTIPT